MRTSTTIASLIEDFEVEPAIGEAVKAFARSKPWRGTIEERKTKFQAFHEQLLAACGPEDLGDVSLLFGNLTGTSSLRSCYRRRQQTIYLTGKLSVVTYLHLFGKARKLPGLGCFQWSLGLFAKYFPRSFASCRQDGLFLVR